MARGYKPTNGKAPFCCFYYVCAGDTGSLFIRRMLYSFFFLIYNFIHQNR